MGVDYKHFPAYGFVYGMKQIDYERHGIVMSIQIITPGAMTTIQDYGRTGYGEIGIAPSGAVDKTAMELANILVGNDMGEAVLECTLLGPAIHFTEDAVIAITGGYMEPKVNDRELPLNTAISVMAGEDLNLGYAVTGSRSYISFAGGLKIRPHLESKSTNLQCGIGGLQGRALKAGDEIQLNKSVSALTGMENRCYNIFAAVAAPKKVRVVLGPQEDYFTEEGLRTFVTGTYRLTSDSNRMACKLSGPVIEGKQPTDIISDGISLGAIQVSSNGQPIVMLCDRQTTGGYAKIGTVISTDISVLAQCKPGDEILFEPISLKEAQKLYKKRTENMRKLQRRVNG